MVIETGFKVYNKKAVQSCRWDKNVECFYDGEGFIKRLRIFTLQFLIMTG